MLKALLILVGGFVIVVPLFIVLIAAAGGAARSAGAASSTAGPNTLPQTPAAERLSSDDVMYLAAMGFMAASLAILAGAIAGVAWASLPIAIWIVIFAGMRSRTQSRASPVVHSDAPPPAARRKESFGKDGVALLERADAAVEKVMTSAAVKEGWLGPPEGIDLRADVTVIEDRLRRVCGIREVITEMSRLPDPSAADRKRKSEAKEAESKLLQDARDRVTRLEVLAREVQATDRELRLRSLTDTGAEHATSLEVVDSTRAMLSAYREVKGLSHLEATSNGSDSKAGEVQKPPTNGNQGLFDMLKQWWSE